MQALHAARCGARRVVAVDLSPRACLFARANAALNGLNLDVREGDLFSALEGPGAPAEQADGGFDVVLANPPFVAAPAPSALRTPTLWADGGPDGLAVTRRILLGAPGHLARGGVAGAGCALIVGEFPDLVRGAGEAAAAAPLPSWLPACGDGGAGVSAIFALEHAQSAEDRRRENMV